MARSRKLILVLCLGILAAIAPTAIVQAEDEEPPKPATATPEKGLALAQRLCSGCHLVEGREGTVPAGIPSLKGIANTKGQTGKRIEQTLIQPHTPMPDMLLTRDEIRHLLAYLETLRTNPEIAPLFQPADPDKPAYPKPS